MKLALVIDDYLPDSTRVGAKMFHELAIELQNQGHKVTVITPQANQHKLLSIDSVDSIKVWRFRSGEIKSVGKVKRAINETLLSFNAYRAITKHITKEMFDGVIYYSPSIFFGPFVKFIKKKCNCSSYLVLRDLFPQWAIDANMIRKGSVIEKYFRFFESMSYSQADTIGLMSEKNIEAFEREYGDCYPTEVLSNWANLSPIRKNHSRLTIRKRYELEDKVIFFYGGNIGHAQDMANLVKLAKAMQSYNKAHFLFVGQGDEVELILSLAEKWKLSNFTYLPSVNQNEFKAILSEVDVGLFSLSAKHTAYNFPGKLLGYMVESLPVLGSVNKGNDLMDIINESSSGYISINGNDKELLKAAVSLYENKYLRESFGENARVLLKEKFSVNSASATILKSLQSY